VRTAGKWAIRVAFVAWMGFAIYGIFTGTSVIGMLIFDFSDAIAMAARSS